MPGGDDEDGAGPAAGVVELPLDGELDLHPFRPKDAADAAEAYLEACREAGVLTVRLIHGRGIGALRRTLEARLGRLSYVVRAWPDAAAAGGATWVELAPPSGG